MAKSKSRAKFDLKQFLLAKGEYVAMGVAGLFLVILLLWGITKGMSAKDPTKVSNELNQGAARVHSNIKDGTINPDDEAKAALPEWVTKGIKYDPIPRHCKNGRFCA